MLLRSDPRRLAAVVIALIFTILAPARAKDTGVITLTLEEPKQSQSVVQPAEPPQGARMSAQPDVKAASAVLMDAVTGQIIYSKNAHVRRPNASTTKIMTAILLIEHCKMEDKVKAGKRACETQFTSIHLKPGEQITVKDLLMGMMVRSANDAAVAAAEHIAGTTAKFAKLMNKKAREIGCANTNFVTPNGLYDKNHYSTVYDLCLMARYAFQYPAFNEAVGTRKHTLESRTLNREDLVLFNKSKFLKDYPGADGVKSGYIKEAGYCFVGSATRDGWRLVSAVLKSDNASRDTAAIMDYGFNNFTLITVAPANMSCAEAEVTGGATDRVSVAPAVDLKVVVPKSGADVTTRTELRAVEAPVAKGAKLGTIVAMVDGADVARVDLKAVEQVDISLARKMNPWLKTGFVGVCLLVGGRYGAALTKNSRRRRRGIKAPLRDVDRYR